MKIRWDAGPVFAEKKLEPVHCEPVRDERFARARKVVDHPLIQDVRPQDGPVIFDHDLARTDFKTFGKKDRAQTVDVGSGLGRRRLAEVESGNEPRVCEFALELPFHIAEGAGRHRPVIDAERAVAECKDDFLVPEALHRPELFVQVDDALTRALSNHDDAFAVDLGDPSVAVIAGVRIIGADQQVLETVPQVGRKRNARALRSRHFEESLDRRGLGALPIRKDVLVDVFPLCLSEIGEFDLAYRTRVHECGGRKKNRAPLVDYQVRIDGDPRIVQSPTNRA